MVKPQSIVPLCEKTTKCEPLQCCTSCHICMRAQFFEAIADLHDAERRRDEAFKFFDNDEFEVTHYGYGQST